MILLILQIIVAVLLSGIILLQQQGGGLGLSFGSASYRTKQGMEKILFRVTIVLIVVFIALAMFLVIK